MPGQVGEKLLRDVVLANLNAKTSHCSRVMRRRFLVRNTRWQFADK